MLLRREMPSWLYQVRPGRHDRLGALGRHPPDGSIHPGTMTTPPDMPERPEGEPHMLSFNHYAYGAVIDWVYRHVAGLAPDRRAPGLSPRRSGAPSPSTGIDWARASVESPYGAVAIDWRIDDAGRFERRRRAALRDDRRRSWPRRRPHRG